MKPPIRHSKSRFLLNMNWIIFLMIFALGYLRAQNFEGPATGQSFQGQVMEVSKLPPLTEALAPFPKGVHSHAIDEHQLEKLKQIVLPPFEGTALPEVDESVSLSGESLTGDLSETFQGISYTGWIPPDPVIAAGQNHVVLVVNKKVAIYTKAGSLVSQTTLSNWFSNVNPPSSPFDPKVAYDHYSSRWIILALAKVEGANLASSYLISVSQTADPTGSWYNFNLDATLNGSQGSNTWADYPGLGFD